MLILNIEELHVKETILGYITRPCHNSLIKKDLFKVVDRFYRHPDAPIDALLSRIEVVWIEDVPLECEHAVHLLDHHEELFHSLMDNKCREEYPELIKTTEKKKFHVFYRCPKCKVEWDDYWDCAGNDHCPKCHAEIEPYDFKLYKD